LALYDGYLLENVRKIIYQWELKMGIEWDITNSMIFGAFWKMGQP
jgi:hypothetical protein